MTLDMFYQLLISNLYFYYFWRNIFQRHLVVFYNKLGMFCRMILSCFLLISIHVRGWLPCQWRVAHHGIIHDNPGSRHFPGWKWAHHWEPSTSWISSASIFVSLQIASNHPKKKTRSAWALRSVVTEVTSLRLEMLGMNFTYQASRRRTAESGG